MSRPSVTLAQLLRSPRPTWRAREGAGHTRGASIMAGVKARNNCSSDDEPAVQNARFAR